MSSENIRLPCPTVALGPVKKKRFGISGHVTLDRLAIIPQRLWHAKMCLILGCIRRIWVRIVSTCKQPVINMRSRTQAYRDTNLPMSLAVWCRDTTHHIALQDSCSRATYRQPWPLYRR